MNSVIVPVVQLSPDEEDDELDELLEDVEDELEEVLHAIKDGVRTPAGGLQKGNPLLQAFMKIFGHVISICPFGQLH